MPNAIEQLVATGALHTYACAVHLQAPAKGPCHCEPDVESILRTLVERAQREALERAASAVRDVRIQAIRPWGLQIETRERCFRAVYALLPSAPRTSEEG